MSDLTVQKRRSGTVSGAERITGVKNAQAEMLLTRKLQKILVKYKKTQQEIQLQEFRLANDAKLLTLDSKQNDLEYKKRLYPTADLSSEEMTVSNLQKYLVLNANNTCYTDKNLTHKIRAHASTDRLPPIVVLARNTVTRNQMLKAIEKSRQELHAFYEAKKNKEKDKRKLHQTFAGEDADSDTDEIEKAMRDRNIPTVQMAERPKTIHTFSVQTEENKELQKVKDALRNNPVVQEAVEAHHQQKASDDQARSLFTPQTIISRMSRRKPLTKTQLMEENSKVQHQVETFCQRIEEQLWQYKEEEFKQGLKFVKDKDYEWNKFMETMQTRNRQNVQQPHSVATVQKEILPKRPATTAYIPITNKEKEKLLMQNVLLTTSRPTESAPAAKRGIPHHTAERIKHHSPTAQLQRMLQNVRAAESKAANEKDSALLTVANKTAEITAK